MILRVWYEKIELIVQVFFEWVGSSPCRKMEEDQIVEDEYAEEMHRCDDRGSNDDRLGSAFDSQC